MKKLNDIRNDKDFKLKMDVAEENEIEYKEQMSKRKLNDIEVVENLYTKDCIRTFSGIYMNVFEPTKEMICIEDIAHALSMQCRFGGHLPNFYSVGRHSLNCSYLIDKPELKLSALLHDASEAYLLDIPRPIKQRLDNYKGIENRLMYEIANKFGFAWPMPTKVKNIDETMLQLEWDCLMMRKRTFDFIFNERETEKDFLQMFNLYKNPIQ